MPEETTVKEEEVAEADPLKIDLDDKTFALVLDDLIKKSRAFFTKKKLKERRERNERYWLGQQIDHADKEGKLGKHDARYLDNLVYEAEHILKPVALSRVPDLIVKPGGDEEDIGKESKDNAERVTKVLNNKLRQRENRMVLGRAYWHRPIYFIGVIKWRWDPEKGRHGDYVFEAIHPYNIDVDHTASSNVANDMDWIVHTYPLSIKEILMRWPKKQEKLFTKLAIEEGKEPTEKKLASKINIQEVWFTWYEKKEDKWQRIEGVGWKYKDVVFDKMRDPNWDWEGEDILFTFDKEGKKERVDEEQFRQSLVGGIPIPGLQGEKIFNNYFKNPQKPFYFLGYDQLGKQPYDETSRIEQGIYLQDNVNIRGKQITEIADGAQGTDVFSTDSGLTADDIEELDVKDPDHAILVDGPLSNVYSHIPGQQPTAALFNEQDRNVSRFFSKMGTNEALRGIRAGPDPATKTQLFKESDYTRIDDEVEDTINSAAEKMAEAAMQMIKLRYTIDHYTELLGSDGQTTRLMINRDFIEDGQSVEVSASSVDKLRLKTEAFNRARLNMTDPLSFFEDTETPDPKGRTEKLMLFSLSPDMYFQQVVKGRETPQDLAGALKGGEGQPGAQQGNQQALLDIAQLQQGGTPNIPEQLDEGYINAIGNFLKSPDFGALAPEIQQRAKEFAQQVIAKARQAGGGQ